MKPNLPLMLLLFWALGYQVANAQVNSTLFRKVNTGSDDAEERVSTGAMDLTSSDLEIMTDGSNNQLIGIRFPNIQLPAGAIIDSVFIQFTNVGDKNPVSGAATIRGELIGNSPTFTTTTSNISARTRTVASTSWAGSTDPTWGTANPNFKGALQRTPDLKTIVQEIVNQGSWSNGNAISFILNGSGVRNARSFNTLSGVHAAELTIFYTETTYTPAIFPLGKGGIWKLNDSGIFPGANWADTSFNDSSWAFKRGKFGYGDTANYAVSFGGNVNDKHTTTYFRNQFTMSNTAGFDTLVFSILCDDGAVIYLNGNEIYRHNMPAGTINQSTLALTSVTGAAESNYIEFRVPNTLANGNNWLAVEVHQADTTSLDDDLGFDLEVRAKRIPMTIVNLPVTPNSEWYYLDNGTDQGTAWRDSSFYEGNWPYGPGILGYGDPSATTLGFGPNTNNKYITYYFRKKIMIVDTAALTDSIIFNIMRDDGAVVYVNGVELFRSNMPDTGAINYLTKSSTIIDGVAERTFYPYTVSKQYFVNGINTIAAEIHQRDSVSSDLTFDMEIKQDDRTLELLAPTQNQTIQAGNNFDINWYSMPSISKVNIELSIDNRATWTPLATLINASARPFSWSVPNINSSVSWIRIADSTQTYKDSVAIWIYPAPTPFNPCTDTLHIGCFTSVDQTRNQLLKLPVSHQFQQVARQGQVHSLGGTVGGNLDFTGFMAANGSSRSGALGINEENTPGGVSVFYIRYDSLTGTWLRDSSGKVNTAAPGVVQFTRNCSGGITPWGTIITSEESYNTGDVNGDGYTDVGWQVEYNPWTREVMDYNGDGTRDKLWAMGRMSHENIALKDDSLTAYYAEDGGSSGLYKFVAFVKTRMDSGTLYVMQRTGSTGNWIVVPNTTQTERNTVSSVVAGLGATNFNGPEDVEINPINGMIYFTSKNNSRIYRFTDNGMTVSNFEDYVGNNTVNYTMNIAGGGTQSVNWGAGIDNLAFDNLGNLWAQQDGGNGHIWVIRPDHTPFAPKIDLFGTTPSGSESGGLTFTPDYRYGFFSIMGASGTNTASINDAAGNSIVFNQSNSVVIANRNYLGALAAVPVTFNSFTARKASKTSAFIQWTTASEENNESFELQRSSNGIQFTPIAQLKGAGNSNTLKSYQWKDLNLQPGIYYYRIKQIDFDGKFSYSEIRSVNLGTDEQLTVNEVYPNPFRNDVHVSLHLLHDETVKVAISDLNGKTVLSLQPQQLGVGEHEVNVNTQSLPAGVYMITVSTQTESYTYKLIK